MPDDRLRNSKRFLNSAGLCRKFHPQMGRLPQIPSIFIPGTQLQIPGETSESLRDNWERFERKSRRSERKFEEM